MEVYTPKSEAGSSADGQVSFDAGELKILDFRKDESFNANNIEKMDILDFGKEGFLLSNLLSELECQDIIKKGEEIGFDSIHGANDNYRSCKRITLENQTLNDILWKRIQPYLGDIRIDGDPTQQHIHGITTVLQGLWKPCGLNNVFRLCRYFPGGHFAPHYDGFFGRSSSERSLQTLMLYLNGGFSGGCTNFVDEAQELHKGEDGKYCAEDKNIIYRIHPKSGLGIIFNHHRLHEGQRLGDGVKYILRTDIMYKNQDKVQLVQTEEKAFEMLQEAERKEACGDCLEAAELYRKAFKLSPTLAEYYKS
ncbi:hypothetical protein SNE40_009397 [Patella caerulea]|uniref:Prolyl 4-hydroxylase alpha subunit domain-containing protein n=1 Tax=Patella caerulea TaxID=87958 RepID=A0AAN8JSI2_PATCE